MVVEGFVRLFLPGLSCCLLSTLHLSCWCDAFPCQPQKDDLWSLPGLNDFLEAEPQMEGDWILPNQYQSGSSPEPLEWEYWVQDARLPENSWAQGVLTNENSQEGLHLYQDLASPKCQQHPVQVASPKQARQKHKCNHHQIIFPQSPQNILPHTALPIREKKSSPTRTQAKDPPNKKPTQTTGPNSPTEGRKQKEGEIQLWSLGKGDLKYSKLEKYEKTKKYCTNEGKRLKLPRPKKRRGNRQSIWKCI